MIAERLAYLKQEIRKTAVSSGRDPDSVHLVAVSKTKPVSDILAAAEAGQVIFGENRVQEAAKKRKLCRDASIQWHMIGHLQKNKAREAASIFDTIHSIDSRKLTDILHRELKNASRSINCFIQVKLSDEESKTGIPPEELPVLAEHIASLSTLKLIGLMGIPPFTPDAENARPYFRKLRALRDELNRTTLAQMPVRELSMGMSHDFRVAIQEGATYIRIGTLLFGERNYDCSK